MNYSPEERELLEEVERRKAAKEDLCNSCYGFDLSSKPIDQRTFMCGECLGEGIVLTEAEYQLLEKMALSGSYQDDDSILDQQDFEY